MSKANPCNQRRLRIRLLKQGRAYFRQMFLGGSRIMSTEDAEVLRYLFPELFDNPAETPLDPFNSDARLYVLEGDCPDCGDDMASGYFDPMMRCERHRP